MRAATILVLALALVAGPMAATALEAPTPTPVAEKVLDALFKALQIHDVDASACVNDVGNAGKDLRDFGDDISTGNYSVAIASLGRGISSLSSAVSGCGVQEVEDKLDALASAVKWANISKLDNVVKIIVGAADLEKDLEALGTAIKSGDPTDIGNALGSLLDQWTAVTGGCGSSEECKFVDGLLRVVQTVAEDFAPCESAVAPAYAKLKDGVQWMHAGNVSAAVADVAAALDELATAFTSDSCGLQKLATVLQTVAPKLAKAVVKDDQIVVEYANVYDEFYQAVIAIQKGDVVGFGVQMGRMLQSLRASGCKTKACVVLQGILGVLQLESSDFAQCASDADNAWNSFVVNALQDFENHQWGAGVSHLANGVVYLARAVSDCGVPDVAKILEDTATKLGDSALATEIGSVESLLVEGADVTDDLAKLAADFKGSQWSAVGDDLHTLATFLTDTKCHSVVCKVVEGLLNAAGTAFQDLTQCEADLKTAQSSFITGSQDFHQKKYGSAVNAYASGLNTIAKAVTDCGISDEIGYLEQEANVLGIANTSVIGEIGSIVVHGADFYEQLFASLQDLEGHDWRAAGQDLGKVMDQLSQWTKGHACTSDICYVVVGVLQFLGDMEGSVKQCETDFKDSWGDFRDAFGNFSDSHHSIFHWHHNADAIKAGVKDLGDGFKLIAKAVDDCHLQEFADLLAKLAAKLGITPEIGFIEEVLHILIEGVHIEQEVGDACDDYADGNWVGFGYNVARLVKTLL